MIDADKANAGLVDALGSALRSGDHGLKAVPALVKKLLASNAWRRFVTKRGELVEYEHFEDFVTTLPLKGLGSSLDLVHTLVADDPEALDLFDQVTGRAHGGDRSKIDNVNLAPVPDGNGRQAALRRLRKDAPELHADVLAGRLTAHAAMVEAGFRKRTVTIPVQHPERVADTLRKHMTPEQIQDLVRRLTS